MFLHAKITVAVVVLLAVTVTTYAGTWAEIEEKMRGYGVDCSDTDIERMAPCAFHIYSEGNLIKEDALQCRFNCSYLDSLIACVDQARVRDICFSTFKENSHKIVKHFDDKLKTNCTNFKNVSSIEEICSQHLAIGNPTTTVKAAPEECQWAAWVSGPCSVTAGRGIRLRVRRPGTSNKQLASSCGIAKEHIACSVAKKPPTLTGWAIGLVVASVVIFIAIATGVIITCHRRKHATDSDDAALLRSNELLTPTAAEI